jgi:hypothetical protein
MNDAVAHGFQKGWQTRLGLEMATQQLFTTRQGGQTTAPLSPGLSLCLGGRGTWPALLDFCLGGRVMFPALCLGGRALQSFQPLGRTPATGEAAIPAPIGSAPVGAVTDAAVATPAFLAPMRAAAGAAVFAPTFLPPVLAVADAAVSASALLAPVFAAAGAAVFALMLPTPMGAAAGAAVFALMLRASVRAHFRNKAGHFWRLRAGVYVSRHGYGHRAVFQKEWRTTRSRTIAQLIWLSDRQTVRGAYSAPFAKGSASVSRDGMSCSISVSEGGS